jgi:FKBP-type peptidyl-prolyl cis-trans isomerase
MKYLPSLRALLSLLACMLLNLALWQCSGQNNEGTPVPAAQEKREQQIKRQRQFIERENESIQAYLKDRGFDWQRDGSGMYYSISRDSSNLEPIKSEDQVFYNFKIHMLNGSLLYSSDESGTQSLVVDKQDAVIGLHQALKRLTLGDTGLFILPSHLAYGVSGDQDRVPPLTALQYEIQVVNIQKSKTRK